MKPKTAKATKYMEISLHNSSEKKKQQPVFDNPYQDAFEEDTIEEIKTDNEQRLSVLE